jgi:hypothetical protein
MLAHPVRVARSRRGRRPVQAGPGSAAGGLWLPCGSYRGGRRSPAVAFAGNVRSIKRLDEAVTRGFPLRRSVDLGCESVLRHHFE